MSSINSNSYCKKLNEISKNILINQYNKKKQRFSKSSGNFDTQSSDYNGTRRCSKIVKSSIPNKIIKKENEILNQTSHFLINNNSIFNENVNVNNSSNSNNINVICDKLTFKNSSHNSFHIDNDENSNNNEYEESGKNLKSLFINDTSRKINNISINELIDNNNNNYYKNNNNNYNINEKNNENNKLKKLRTYENKPIYKNNYIEEDFTLNNNLQQKKRELSNVETLQKKNVLNSHTIPMLTKQILLKSFNEYLINNKPIVYSEEIKSGNIFGFSALTFRNSCPKCRTTISININLKNEFGILHFFDLHSILIKNDILKSKIKILSTNEIIDEKFFTDIIGNIVILKFQNDNIFLINNNTKKLSSYKGILSVNNSSNILFLNNIQNIPSPKLLDFILLFNRGIFQVLTNKDIIIIIYKTLLEDLLNNSTFDILLEDIVKNLFNASISYGGNRDMACLFICFENFKKLFLEKNIDKIYDFFHKIEIGIFDNEEDEEKIPDLFSPQKSIRIKNYNNLTFNDRKSNTDDSHKIIIKPIHKKKTFFNCCGLFIKCKNK